MATLWITLFLWCSIGSINCDNQTIAWNNARCQHNNSSKTIHCDGLNSLFELQKHFDDSILNHIEVLNIIGDTNLTSLNKPTFTAFKKLRDLSIRLSAVSEIVDVETFHALSELQTLDLSNNLIETIDWHLFERLSGTIFSLNITGNPLACESCRNQWLVKWNELGRRKLLGYSNGSKEPVLAWADREFQLKVMSIVDYERLECRNGKTWMPIESAKTPDSCPKINIEMTPNLLEVMPGEEPVQFQCSVVTAKNEGYEHNFNLSLQYTPMQMDVGAVTFKKETETERMLNMNISVPSIRINSSGYFICVVEGPNLGAPVSAAAALAVYSAPELKSIVRKNQSNPMLAIYRMLIIAYPKPNISIEQPMSMNIFALGINRWRVDFAIQPDAKAPPAKVKACNSFGCDEKSLVYSHSHGLAFKRSTTKPGQVQFATVAIICLALILISLTLIYLVRKVKSTGRRKSEMLKQCQYTEPTDSLGMLPGKLQEFLSGLTEGDTKSNLRSPSDFVENPLYSAPLLGENINVVDINRLTISQKIGNGAYGTIFYGMLKEPSEEETPVAVKCMNVPSRVWAENFVREAEVIASLDHPNIVSFRGICPRPNDVLLLFEFMDLGDLRTYLINNTPNSGNPDSSQITHSVMVQVALQVANGLEYLAEKRLVHRDVAARNCLLKSPLTVKLADFGLSRSIQSSKYYEVKSEIGLPIRWLAPESLAFGKFCVESDVWSFGVLLWELFSYGMTPWSNLVNSEVAERVQAGEKLTPPSTCPYDIYQLMLACWCYRKDDRITIDEAIYHLQAVAQKYEY